MCVWKEKITEKWTNALCDVVGAFNGTVLAFLTCCSCVLALHRESIDMGTGTSLQCLGSTCSAIDSA